MDSNVQRTQSLLAHALSAILGIINEIGSGTAGLTESHLQTLTDANRLVTFSFSSLIQVRKELIRNALGFPIVKLCSWDFPVGQDLLFPELGKKLKDRGETTVNLHRRQQNR